MKFGTNKTAHLELGDSHVTKREKSQKFKMADGRHFKNRFGHTQQMIVPISVKFCTGKQNSMR